MAVAAAKQAENHVHPTDASSRRHLRCNQTLAEPDLNGESVTGGTRRCGNSKCDTPSVALRTQCTTLSHCDGGAAQLAAPFPARRTKTSALTSPLHKLCQYLRTRRAPGTAVEDRKHPSSYPKRSRFWSDTPHVQSIRLPQMSWLLLLVPPHRT